MNQSDYTYSSIHNDVAFKIVSSLTVGFLFVSLFLPDVPLSGCCSNLNPIHFPSLLVFQVPDLSSLSCCSRVWREIWGSDCVWEPLFKQRWPFLYEETVKDPNSSFGNRVEGVYIKQHKEMRDQAESVIKLWNNVRNPNHPGLGCQGSAESSKIFDRQVLVKWWKLGRWFYGFRMRDEFHSRCLSLEDLATFKDDTDVLGVLHRGAIHEVLQVQISVVNSTSSAWLNLSSQ
ncbi:hypothetical protein F3Y22_tig00110332pilonHSYRG00216 [Hibiscus syriacus]|uniref:F-box domain-containing protein n=1 Tax=Hibiscus syriacus TaxID=106335 RepID=A0A6A3AWK0_HIBSY|nr:hypothetical protein F3Y22_tig00110332pilonHSYRG00216 [Hibiscus syriacus]